MIDLETIIPLIIGFFGGEEWDKLISSTALQTSLRYVSKSKSENFSFLIVMARDLDLLIGYLSSIQAG